MFDFRRMTLFCLEKRLSKHEMTICSKIWGGHGLFASPWLRLCITIIFVIMMISVYEPVETNRQSHCNAVRYDFDKLPCSLTLRLWQYCHKSTSLTMRHRLFAEEGQRRHLCAWILMHVVRKTKRLLTFYNFRVTPSWRRVGFHRKSSQWRHTRAKL